MNEMISSELLLQKGAVYKDIAAGEVIFSEGCTGNYYFQLVSGRVRWSNFSADGKEILHWIVESGESFGEFPLIDGQPYAATAIADTACQILRLRASAFLSILDEHPEMAWKFTQLLVERLRFHFYLINSVTDNSPGHVLENLIAYYKQKGQYVCKDCNQLMLTRQQLANMTGMRVETVIRTIKTLQKEKKLDVIKGKVFLGPSNGRAILKD